jgi:hypothetical protein
MIFSVIIIISQSVIIHGYSSSVNLNETEKILNISLSSNISSKDVGLVVIEFRMKKCS